MTTIRMETPLSQAVNENPQIVPILEDLGLDFCCGGAQTLAEACRGKGLDPKTVVAMLGAVGRAERAPSGFDERIVGLSTSEMTHHIERTHHAFLHAAVPRLRREMDAVLHAHGAKHPELRELRSIMLGFFDEIQQHMAKEEQILFPMIRGMAEPGSGGGAFHCGGVEGPIHVMREEHDAAGRAMARMRSLGKGYQVPADACETWKALYRGLDELERDMHVHVHTENNLLFPRALSMES